MRLTYLVAAATAMLAQQGFAQTAQTKFDAAQSKLENKDFAGAAADFRRIISEHPKLSLRTVATVRTQLAQALIAQGFYDQAIEQYELALSGYGGKTDEERRERANLYYWIGVTEEGRQNYSIARLKYSQALNEGGLPDDDRQALTLRVAIARTSLFSHPETARSQLDFALPLFERVFAAEGKRDNLGDIYALRGRVELNQRNYPAARQWFDKALKAAGGMGTKISVADTRIRSDLAIVYHLLGNDDEARRYLAYTGAGRLPDDALPKGDDMPLPPCGELSGIRRDDMVIMEFSVLKNGRIVAPTPVYSTRPGQIEEAFAKEVARWTWAPDVAEKMPDFWRSSVRVELRCSSEPATLSLQRSMISHANRWLSQQGAAGVQTGEMSDATALPLIKTELAKREAADGPNSLQLLPVLLALSENAALTKEEAMGYTLRGERISGDVKAHPDVWGAFAYSRAELSRRSGENKYKSRRTYDEERLAMLRGLLEQIKSSGREKTRAEAFIRSEAGQAYQRLQRDSDAAAEFMAVTDLPSSILPESDPIRQAALLQLASLKAVQKDVGTARALLQETGLTPEQCALVDVQPLLVSGKLTANVFPDEAIRWGFGGIVRISYDIDTQGRPLGARTVMAYPPFVFGPATEKAISRFRFRPIFRDGAAVGCVDRLQSVRYSIPR